MRDSFMKDVPSIKSFAKPFSIKSLHLNNRCVMAPMTRSMSPKHIPGEHVAQYYRRRAKGKVGLIITEGTVVNHKAAHGYPDVPNFFGKESLDGWRKVVEEVHAEGGKIIPQIWHVGSMRQLHKCKNSGVDNPRARCSHEEEVPGYAPSAIPHPGIEGADIPHEMNRQDIHEIIAAFAQAAKDAQDLGFDGVEIHGAHGYLIDQFFWDYTNKRTDEYGGNTLAKRTRFAVEIIQAIRDRVGPNFMIDFRFSQWKLGNYKAKMAHNPQELESFLLPLSNAGVDLFHCSTRKFYEPEFPDSTLNLAGWTKKITGKPTITVGSVGLDTDFIATRKHSGCHFSTKNLCGLLERLATEEFDLVAVGRALLADPFWFQKILEGKQEEILYFSQEALKTLS